MSALGLPLGCHVCQRSVRWDRWLYMRTYHDGYHPHFEDEMLFDIEADRFEKNNLIDKHPEIVRELTSRLRSWLSEPRLSPYTD